jgi:alpha-tubulin suppressor-like RCC1 family protein
MWTTSLWWAVAAAAAPSVAVGQSHSCARVDAAVYCWGGATVEQLKGDGSPRKTAQRVEGLPSVKQVAVGSAGQTCAVAHDGARWCWGLDEAPAVQEGGPFVQLSLGGRHGCGVDAGGRAQCWGAEGLPQLGGEGLSTVPPLKTVSAGEDHTCGLGVDGTVWCWGSNDLGQLGRGRVSPHEGPGKVAFLADAVDVAAGAFHTCAVRSNGQVWCWGDNIDGQLGDGTRTRRAEVGPVSFVQGAVGVTSGFGHSCALLGGGALRCWGASDRGQLAVSDNADQLVPRKVEGLTGVRDVSAGQQHTCAATDDAVWCWGSNTTSQLGDGTRDRRHEPAEVVGLP